MMPKPNYRANRGEWLLAYFEKLRELEIPGTHFLYKSDFYDKFYNLLKKNNGFGDDGSSFCSIDLHVNGEVYREILNDFVTQIPADQSDSTTRDNLIFKLFSPVSPKEEIVEAPELPPHRPADKLFSAEKPSLMRNILTYGGLGLLTAAGAITAGVVGVAAAGLVSVPAAITAFLGAAGLAALLTPPGLIAIASIGLAVGVLALGTIGVIGIRQFMSSRAEIAPAMGVPPIEAARPPEPSPAAKVVAKGANPFDQPETEVTEGKALESDENPFPIPVERNPK